MMPKKKLRETPEQQAERFRAAVQDMIDAGELSPTEADARFEQAMGGVARLREEWFDGGAEGTRSSEPDPQCD
jgi:hypothetical protein